MMLDVQLQMNVVAFCVSAQSCQYLQMLQILPQTPISMYICPS